MALHWAPVDSGMGFATEGTTGTLWPVLGRVFRVVKWIEGTCCRRSWFLTPRWRLFFVKCSPQPILRGGYLQELDMTNFGGSLVPYMGFTVVQGGSSHLSWIA